jgi:hypothetical protein
MVPAEIYIGGTLQHTIGKNGGGFQNAEGVKVEYDGDHHGTGRVYGPNDSYAGAYILGENQESDLIPVTIREVPPIEKGEKPTKVTAQVSIKRVAEPIP